MTTQEDLDVLVTKVRNTTGVIRSGTMWMQGSSERLRVAVEEAIANGATREQLQPVLDEVEAQAAAAQEMATALAANP